MSAWEVGGGGDTDYVVSYIELKALLRASWQSLWQYRGAYLDDRSAGSWVGSAVMPFTGSGCSRTSSYHTFMGVAVRLIARGLHQRAITKFNLSAVVGKSEIIK